MFSVASFLAAFLLFSAQPFLGKVLLPGYGGTAAVWMTCSLFFQLILLFGYGYTHLVFGSTNSLYRSLAHASIILASLIFLPLAIASPSASAISAPILQIIKSLTLAVGVPIFILASSAPLLQKWFSVKYPQENPYWLYALSNAGSLFALLSYPFLLEPTLSLDTQSRMWSALFTLYCLIFLALTVKSTSAAPKQFSQGRDRSYCCSLSGILVLLFSATGSALMLSATNQLCCELVSIPLLWVLPLTIYLFTFIIIFARKSALSRVPFLGIAIVSFATIAWLIRTESAFGSGVVWLISIYLVIIGCGCMLAHRELFILKPTSSHLTAYYLMLSAGGALGGVFVAVVSPLLFSRYFESGISWILLATLVLISKFREDGWKVHGRERPFALSASVVGSGVFAILVIICGSSSTGEMFVARNFYGVMRVVDGTVSAGVLRGTAVRDFFHGNTLHGSQFLDSRGREIPTTYFSAQSGAGLAMRFIHSDRPRRIGVLGLGVGTLTTYAKQGDTFRIYELEPMVGLVENKYFSYL